MEKITKERVLEIFATYEPHGDPIDLCHMDLSGMDLSGMNFCGVYLCGSNLSGTNLSNANLSFAKLQGANLTNADLSCADLTNAILHDADLTNAKLPETIPATSYEMLVVSYYNVWEPHKRESYNEYPVKDYDHAVELVNALKKSMRLQQELGSELCADYYLDKKNNHDRIYL